MGLLEVVRRRRHHGLLQHHRPVIYSKIMEAYTQEAFVVSKLGRHDSHSARRREDSRHRPRRPTTCAESQPGMPYPSLGFGEDYIETPATTKRGFIVPVTQGGDLLRPHAPGADAGGRGGRGAGAEQGEAAAGSGGRRIANNYKWKGTAYNTYQASTPRGSTSRPATSWSTGPTSTRPSSSSPTSSIPTPASRCWCRQPPCW